MASYRIDDEWLELYNFQRSMRSLNGVTASDILKSLDLPLSLLQYMYSSDCVPSIRPGTMGHKLRLGISSLRMNATTVEACRNITYMVREFFEANKIDLLRGGIDSLYVSEDNELVIGKTMTVSPEQAEVALRLIHSDPNIGQLPIKVQIWRDLSIFQSPVCVGARN